VCRISQKVIMYAFVGSTPSSHRLNRNISNGVNRNTDTQRQIHTINTKKQRLRSLILGNLEGARNRVTVGWSRGGERTLCKEEVV